MNYEKEVNEILPILKAHPEGLTVGELSNIMGYTVQKLKIILPYMYMYSDDVYLTSYIMKVGRHIRLVNHYCAYEYKDDASYKNFRSREDVIRQITYDYESRKKTFEVDYKHAYKSITKDSISLKAKL